MLPEECEADPTSLIRQIGTEKQNILQTIEHSVRQLEILSQQEVLYQGTENK